jgi:hypothetical protein
MIVSMGKTWVDFRTEGWEKNTIFPTAISHQAFIIVSFLCPAEGSK